MNDDGFADGFAMEGRDNGDVDRRMKSGSPTKFWQFSESGNVDISEKGSIVEIYFVAGEAA
jgi:hypothetical protein